MPVCPPLVKLPVSSPRLPQIHGSVLFMQVCWDVSQCSHPHG